MKAAIEPLASLPGVDLVMLATLDGVPIVAAGPKSDQEAVGPTDGNDAHAAMALSWMGELEHATSPLGWSAPRRAHLRCARGSLVMERCRGAMLILFLGRGASPDDVRLAMDGVIARIERTGRGTASKDASRSASLSEANPPAPIPSRGAHASREGNRSEGGLAETTNPSSNEGPAGH